MKKSIGTGRGSVYNIILKALQSGDKYGYEICKEVETKTEGSYILKQPSLYSGLKRLEAQDDVTSYWGDSDIGGRRHYYSLTEKGRQRIEQSDFSWEDSRNEIVENMFERSELDSSIDNMKSELSQMSKDIAGANTVNTEIESIISGEITAQSKPVSPVKTVMGHRISDYQEDLFSLGLKNDAESSTGKEDDEDKVAGSQSNDFPSLPEARNEEEKPEALHGSSPEQEGLINLYVDKMKREQEKFDEMELLVDKTLELKASSEEKTPSDIQSGEIKNEEFPVALSDESDKKADEEFKEIPEKEQQTEDIVGQSKMTEEPAEEEKRAETDENKLTTENDDKENFDIYFKDRQRKSFSNYVEERSSLPLSRKDLENSDRFYGSKSTDEKIEFEEKKTSSNQISLTPDDNSKKEEEDDFEIRYQKFQSAFDRENFREDKEAKERETLMANSLSGDVPHTEPLNETGGKSKEINLKSIFSEFYDDSEKQSELPEKFNEYKSDDEEKLSGKKDLSQTENQLPRYNLMDNINLSLDKTGIVKPKNMPEHSTYEEDLFDRTRQYHEHSAGNNASSPQQPQKHTISEEKIPFDVKYAKMKYDLNDYKIRNHRKSSVENKVTRFIAINKLNLAVYSIYSLISFLLTFVVYITVNSLNMMPEGQMFFYILCFIFPLIMFGIHLLIFAQNKFKRIRYKSAKDDILNYLFLSVIAIVLLFAFNMLFGMTLNNIGQHMASFVIPVVDILLLSLSPLAKSILARNSYFSK